MEGYVINRLPSWTHAMKRSVGPGGKIPLKELFEQYGIKHGLTEGPEFIEWLRSVKLNDKSRWNIVIEDNIPNDTTSVEAKEAVTKSSPNRSKGTDAVTPLVSKKLNVADIVGLSVRQARDMLPKITDLNLLKYAMQEANQLSGKDSLCRIIRKRIKELQLSR
jgi:hypothetical protein